MASTLFKDITLMTHDGEVLPHAYVGVFGQTIDYVGFQMPAGQDCTYDYVYDGRGKLLMPGLYNAHAHVPMTLLRGRGENLALDSWLNDSIFPFEALIDDKAAYAATMLGIAEMIRFGTVSFTDMYYHSDARAKAILESGIKCNLGHSVLCFDPEKAFEDLPENEIDQHLVNTYHRAGGERLLVDMNLHAEYTSTRKVAESLARAAKNANLRMQVHVSETASEVQACKERHGMTPVEYLADCGIFDVPTTAAHCVHLEQQDYAILANKGVFVATCPASNAKLGSGIADVCGMRDAGITIALGTDGVASNNNHNMFKDMYLMALMQRAGSQTSLGLSSPECITIATRNGALSQGREDCGFIVPGAHADLIVLDIDTPWMNPIDSMASNIVYSAEGSDVVLTMVDGVILYKEGEYLTIDMERSLYETVQARESIISQLG